jgi:(R,R)-butanediol dehydrogenase / meso-butanediol dehydrogenase / diacetyl reductase
MRAARFHDREDIRVEDVAEPPAPRDDEVLIAVEWCGICGSDLHEYRVGPIQTSHTPHPLTGATVPQILGHELSGRVLAAGPASRIAEGSRVAVMPLVTCGTCASCRRGLNQLCTRRAAIGMNHRWGGFASRTLVGGANVVALPDELSMEQGALLEPAAVAVTAVQRGDVGSGSRVFVGGYGPIGALVALAARAAGAQPIVVSEPSAGRAAHAAALGGVHVVDPIRDDVGAALRELTDDEGVDVAFECVGNERALQACIEVTRPSGTVVLCGLHPEPPRVDLLMAVEKQLTLVASYCYDTHDWSPVVELLASGRLPAERVVTRRIGLQRVVEDGFVALGRPDAEDIKVLVDTTD